MMVEYKGHKFETNPNQLSVALQFKGEIYIKLTDNPCMRVYGLSEKQIMDQANKFREIEPKAFAVEIYGPENHGSLRTYVTTKIF